MKYKCKTKTCSHEICHDIWKYGSGLCRSCAGKNKKPHKAGCQCFICKSKRGEYHGENTSNYIDGRTNRKYYCKVCNKSITIYSKSGMCGSCVQKGKQISKNQKQKISLSKGGTGIPYEYYKYPAMFYKLKEEIKKRDNYTCQLCGITEEEYIMVHGILLDIHHIDYNKWNSNKKNLLTLCRGCNSRVNINRKHWRKYFQRYINKILKKEVSL